MEELIHELHPPAFYNLTFPTVHLIICLIYILKALRLLITALSSQVSDGNLGILNKTFGTLEVALGVLRGTAH